MPTGTRCVRHLAQSMSAACTCLPLSTRQVVAWWNAKSNPKNIICDGRIISTMWKNRFQVF